MVMPPDVQSRLDALAQDVYSAYASAMMASGNLAEIDPAGTRVASMFIARHLMKWGWQKGAEHPPRCANRNPLCFDPEPHAQCDLW